MKLSLRAKLRLTESCSDAELQEVCRRYYTIYKGIMDSSVSEDVKAVAAAKLMDLMDHIRKEGIQLQGIDEVSYEPANANINATVERELAISGNALNAEKAARLNKMIAALPHSAKRYYLSALVLLNKKDRSMDDVKAAAEKLKSACREDPENIVYTALLEEIRKEAISYNDELDKWKEDEEGRLRKERFLATVTAIFKGIGTVLLWLGGAALTIGSVVASCVCGMCDMC